MDMLKGQNVVVLGGSSGIGLEVVRQVAHGGARVIAAGRDRHKLETALRGVSGQIHGISVDATDRFALDACFQQAGVVDHLVLTLSGAEGSGVFAQLDLEALRRGFEAKFWPHLQAAQAALPVMRRGGSITFVTAISARIARAGVAGLGAINGALESMIGTLALELAPTRVNAVSPGVIDTPWWDRLPSAEKADVFHAQAASSPAGRVGRSEDVARAVLFLVESDFVTGTVVLCDGGLHLL